MLTNFMDQTSRLRCVNAFKADTVLGFRKVVEVGLDTLI